MAYNNTRLRREIGRYLRTLPDRGLTRRYSQSIRRTLLKFEEHCTERGVKTVERVNRDTIVSFLDTYSGMTASMQRQTACFLRMFLVHFDNRAIRTLKIRTSGPSRVHVDWLTPDETRLIMMTDMTPRQAVLIGAGLLQGMRRIETLRLTVKDTEDALKTGVLRIRGKGYKERAVPLHVQFQGILQTYLRMMEPAGQNDPLIRIRRTRSEEDLSEFCSRFGKKFTFHTMRRTFGRNLWLLGVRLETISELLGHSSTDMTRLYLGLDLLDMRNALSVYRLPDAHVPTSRTCPSMRDEVCGLPSPSCILNNR